MIEEVFCLSIYKYVTGIEQQNTFSRLNNNKGHVGVMYIY